MAMMTSADGPLGPGLRPPLGEYSSRYFRFFSDDCSTAPGPVQLDHGGEQLKNKEDEIFHCSRE